jgi:hypothetical protein
MLMKDDKKKMASVIMAKMGGAPEAPPIEPENVESDDSMALETAGQELADALKSGSGKQVAEAFKAMMALCEVEGPEVEVEVKPEA